MFNKLTFIYAIALICMPIFSIDLISGSNSSFAYLDGFSYSKFEFVKVTVISGKGEDEFIEKNENLAEKIKEQISEELTKNIDLKLDSNNISLLSVKAIIEIKHGSKAERLYRFNSDGDAQVNISLYGVDKYGREVFFVNEIASLSHSVFGGDFKNVFSKSLKGFTKTLNFVLVSQRNLTDTAKSETLRKVTRLVSKRQLGVAPSSGFKSKKKILLKDSTDEGNHSSEKKISAKGIKDYKPKNLVNIGLGVGGFAFVGAEYKLRVNRKVGAFLGLSLFGSSVGGMLFFNDDKLSNYISIGIDTFMIQRFVGAKIQYGDYFFKHNGKAFSYEVGLYKVFVDNFIGVESQDDTVVALSLGYAF